MALLPTRDDARRKLRLAGEPAPMTYAPGHLIRGKTRLRDVAGLPGPKQHDRSGSHVPLAKRKAQRRAQRKSARRQSQKGN
jgi:hypothetical protein